MEEIEVYDGIEFTTLCLQEIDEKGYLKLFAINNNSASREYCIELYQDNKGDYFIYFDFLRVFNDLKKIKIDNEIIEAIKR